jgi:hypothetical protein
LEGKIFIFQYLLNFMTLDEFFRECKQKGATPLSYKEFTESINGTKTVEYENPAYRKAKEVIGRVLNRGRGNGNGNSGIDGLVSNLYGEDIVIHTKDGYHHGKLLGYDGESFMLGNYLFNDRPMEMMDYETEFFYGGDTIIPAKDIISVSRISDLVGEFA